MIYNVFRSVSVACEESFESQTYFKRTQGIYADSLGSHKSRVGKSRACCVTTNQIIRSRSL